MEESWPDADLTSALYLRFGGNDPVGKADGDAVRLDKEATTP